ncbi:MAG: hypothetical protein OHK0019_00840 [Saprospiraceae bacterium]
MWGYILTAFVFFVGGFFVAAMLAAAKRGDEVQSKAMDDHEAKMN